MKRILSILTALVLLCIGWVENVNAQQTTVSVVYGTTGEETYGAWDGGKTTWTSNAASGMAGMTLTRSGGSFDKFSSWEGYYNLAYYTAGTERLTLTAPDGYIISGYSVKVAAGSSSAFYTLTADNADGTSVSTSSTAVFHDFNVSGLETPSTVISVNGTGSSYYMCLANFVVYLSPRTSYTVAICDNTGSGFNNGKGTFANATTNTYTDKFTSNAASGCAGVELTSTTSDANFTVYTPNNIRCMALRPRVANQNYQLNITAPAGYVITGYEVGGYCYNNANTYTLTSESGKETATITSTSPSGTTPSLTVTGLATSSTYFYFKATNRYWLAIPWFKVYLKKASLPTSITDGGVYSLRSVYKDGAFPIYNNSGVPGVSTDANGDPQLFVFRASGENVGGVNLYKLQKADGDGNFLEYNKSNGGEASFSTTESTYMLVNSSHKPSSGATANGTLVSSPYVHLVGRHENGGNQFVNLRGPQGTSSTTLTSRTNTSPQYYATTDVYNRSQTQYSYRWLLTVEPYTVYDVVVKDALGTPTSGIAINYTGSASNVIANMTTAQQNGGFFVFKNGVTPTESMFSCAMSEFVIQDFDLTGTTLTFTLDAVNPSSALDGGVYSIYCSYSDGNYPVYTDPNETGKPSISTSTSTTPQMFVFRNMGTHKSIPYYKLQKAEGDRVLHYAKTSAPGISYNTSTDAAFFFLNTSNVGSYTFYGAGQDGEDAPYTGFYGGYFDGENKYSSFCGRNSNATAFNGWSNRATLESDHLDSRNGSTDTNTRWLLKKEPYNVYGLVVQDAGGSSVTSAYIGYANAADVEITRTAQTNGGFFVIKSGVTPSAEMFYVENEQEYNMSGISITGSTITVTVASKVTSNVVVGRYYIKNRGRNRWLRQESDAISGTDACGTTGYVWDVVASGTANQYYLRNEADGRYIQKATADNVAYTLVENKSDATPVRIYSDEISAEGRALGCVGIKATDGNSGPLYFNMMNHNPYGVVRWYAGSDAASEWFFYCADTEVGTEFLIQCKNSTKFAARGADDNAQLVQIAKGSVDGTNSIWTLTASGAGYEMANGGTSNKLATVTASGTFTAAGVPWYIQKDATDNTYYNISTTPDFSGNTSWNNAGGQGNNVGYWHPASSEPGSCWRFITPDQYFWEAIDYIKEIYDEGHKNDLFYLKESAYNTLISAAHGTKAEKIAAANAIYNALNDFSNINMPENGKDYLIKNMGLQVILSQTRYLYTSDTNVNLADGPYNSSYFWHVEKVADGQYHINQCCYGQGQYPSANLRYIAGTQGGNSTRWTYTNTKPTATPLTMQMYSTNEIPYMGTISILAGGNRMNGNGYDVLTWNAQDNNCKWQFIPIEEASASLIATAETAVAVARANSGAAFTLTAEVIDDIEDAIEALESTPTYVNYYILEQLLKDHTNYYWLANGRYLVRNYEFDPDGDGTANDTETYLTSLINPEGVVEDAIGYWSIWDITNVGLGQYTVVNEGNKFILAPGSQLDGDPTTDERNQGLLFYDTSAGAFQVGDPEGGDESTLYFYPAAEVSAVLPPSQVVSGDFAAISVPSQVSQGKYMNMFTQSDHVASYSTTPTSRRGCFWQFIPINSQNETNHEGTHSGEAEMFANQVNGLAGYVGGVVTLENVESVPCLNDIVLLRNAAVAALDGGTALNFTNSPYEAVSVNQGDYVGAKAYRAILDRIHDIKDGKEPDGSTNNDLKKYYQDLRPTEVINGANVYHPFFLENMSGQRPEYGGRLAQTTETGYWKCIPQVDANNNLSVFYVRRNGAVGNNATYWLRNGEKTGVGNFLKHGTLANNEEVGYVAHDATDSNGDGIPDEALEFRIDPVIPGVWQMYDVGAGSGPSRYMTITGLGPTIPGHNFTIQYYNKSETSTLWKFKTFNDLDKIYLRPGSTTGGMDFFCTFSYPLNIQIPKTGNPTPYYCSAAYRSTSAENAALKVVFEIVPSNATYYFLKGNEGYMFMTDETTAENLKVVDDANDTHNGYVYIDDAQFMSGPIPVALPENSMKANLNTTYVTSENWANIYALGNVSTGTQVGSFHGNPVYGIGVGFYHVRIGGKLNPNTAYIPRNRFVAVDEGSSEWTSVKEMSESGIPAEIIFKDEMGNIVDQIEVLPDGTTQRTADGPVYDLAGRRITKPTRGIYIQNGRKVMYK